MRFQWHNPNGTLISNQWFLRLADMSIYESGVYVCTVSVEVNGTQREASRGTNIQVKPGKTDTVITGGSAQTPHVVSPD
ncbi:unnamed protein product [Hydatigera taeniaeformis]|uniref:Ig-like domain-containing protein n=1 Tax=Hydatigena taeniaeformis TaxID=6205 RepID=A0A0R3WYZ1_HYDTA|nr:unnamed protein product [Hydatigera taeniaeformis]